MVALFFMATSQRTTASALQRRAGGSKRVDPQSMFVSIVSHQLRTPLSSVKWLLEALVDNRKHEPLSDFQKRYLEQAYESNERMISLVDDLLNVARLDAGKMKNAIVACDLAPIFESVINEMQLLAAAYNVRLACTFCRDEISKVRCDPDNMRLVIQNILSNAVKYSRGKSVVNVDAHVQGRRMIFGIHDDGIGIPKAEERRVFQPFFRASNAQATRAEGSGLGLYIAQKIVTLNAGRCWVERRAGGTSVFFSLPRAEKKKL